ncbi:TPA: hypothetical protein DIV45_03035 [Patescibacteria group bacterium]|nr:hypothetical protein [Patescibacteria group bacterium]
MPKSSRVSLFAFLINNIRKLPPPSFPLPRGGVGGVAGIGIFERLLLLLLFTLGFRPLLDPDFGWHLRSGIDLLKNWSVPKLDIYSYTLPDWPWVNHEWLSDGLMALIYQWLGPLVLGLLFSGLIAGTFLLAASLSKVELRYKIIAALIGLLAALPILGVRMQMITLLLMSTVLWLLTRYQQKQLTHLWYLPLIFLLWANLHGGFLIGFVILAIWWLMETIKYTTATIWPKWYKKMRITETTLTFPQIKHLLTVGLLSGLITLINPYGWGLHYDFYKLFTNPFAINNISEWQSVSLAQPMAYDFAIYLVVLMILLILTYRKIEPTRWALWIALLGLSFLYWRNMPFFMIASLGFLAETIQKYTHLAWDAFTRHRWLLIGFCALIAILISQRILDNSQALNIDEQLRQSRYYPVDAINWAKTHPDKIGTKMFNEYGWGGFLIWRFPEQKVFIDGRMPYWQMGDKFVFADTQYATSAGAGAIGLLEVRYGVDWIMVLAGRPLDWALSGQSDWEKVYNDNISVIYRKINLNNIK